MQRAWGGISFGGRAYVRSVRTGGACNGVGDARMCAVGEMCRCGCGTFARLD